MPVSNTWSTFRLAVPIKTMPSLLSYAYLWQGMAKDLGARRRIYIKMADLVPYLADAYFY
jgi:hypothetical protein